MKGHELGYETKDMGSKKTVDKLIFIKTKTNISIEWKGWLGKIFINHMYDKGLISKIYRELLKLNRDWFINKQKINMWKDVLHH